MKNPGKGLIFFIVPIIFGAFWAGSVFAEEEPRVPTVSGQRIRDVPIDNLAESGNKKFTFLYERLMSLTKSVEFSKEELLKISPSINKIALYRNADRENRLFPSKTYNLIENRLMQKLLETNRFQINECMECKSTQLLIKRGSFTILRAIESNARLSEIADKIGVNGFFMWNVYYDKEKLYLNLQIVDTKTGEIKWVRKVEDKFEEEEEARKKQAEVEKRRRATNVIIYTGAWGFKVTRKSTNNPHQSADMLAVLGFRAMKESAFSRNMVFGVGLDIFTNMAKRDYINLFGNVLYAQVSFKLDPLFKESGDATGEEELVDLEEGFSTFNFYLAVGEAFYKDNFTEAFKGGFDIHFSERFHFNLGFIYMPIREVEMPDVAGYLKKVDFGGFTYDINLGIVF